MKKTIITLIGIVAAVALFWGCSDDVTTTRTYVAMEPVIMTAAEARSSFEILPPIEIAESGKIYWKDGYLFISEPNKGIHLFDNTNPENPIPLSFVNIPGNTDLAVQGTIMYANSFADLLALDISDPTNIQLMHRSEDVFAKTVNEIFVDDKMGYLVDWVEKEVVEKVDNNQNFFFQDDRLFVRTDFATLEAGSFDANSTGIGGSMARFTINKGHLFTIDDSNMYIFDLEDGTSPELINEVYINWGIETIFPFKDKIFIGSQSGMYIYDVQNPTTPVQLSVYEHIFSCDPVVANDSLAFVTLRDGNLCRTDFSNQLEVIDIKDLTAPKLLYTYQMKHPHGLGIRNHDLFICEGKYGLKWFDYEEPDKIDQNQLSHIKNFHAYDVIPIGDLLIMIGSDGLYQFDISEKGKFRQLSHIKINDEPAI
jgi:hypothetical protein